MRRPSHKWRQMAEVYRFFAKDYPNLDYSDKAALAMFKYESKGGPSPGFQNGFYTGKHWMDATVKMWLEDLGTILFEFELYADPDLPNWWLDKVLPK